MLIGVHNEPAGGAAGGSESCVAVLAEALARRHAVELVHHRAAMTVEQLQQLSGTDLGAVRLRYVPHALDLVARTRNPWRLHRELVAWQESLSKPYDLFVTFTHGVPPHCRAAHGVFVVLFPVFGPRLPVPWKEPWRAGSFAVKALRRLYWNWGWRRRLATYQLRLAISEYTRAWTRRLWGVDCQVLYPPVDTSFPEVPKSDLILSVGRFTTSGHRKRQHELMAAYRDLVRGGLQGWGYQSVGGLGESPEDSAYFAAVRGVGQECGGEAVANLPRGPLRALYEQAKVFWHAAGYGDDPTRRPELSEHFGISTVEAMAAGCVPIVINQGAQPELIEHGVTGFLWNTLDELKDYTLQMAHDDARRCLMAQAARARAAAFGRESFVKSFCQLLGSMLGNG
jgi:glycosyltransferase involved in cell wall biosynthesis